MKPSYARHRPDTTAKALTACAKRLGARVLALNGVIDCVLDFRGQYLLVDWKTPGETTLTDAQAKLVAAGWQIHFISTENQLRALLTRAV